MTDIRLDPPMVYSGASRLAPVVASHAVQGAATESPLFVVADGSPLTALWDAVTAGARLTLFVPLGLAARSADQLAAIGITLGQPVRHANPLNPLVASTDASLQGRGPLDGLRLTVAAACSVDGIGESVADDSDGRCVIRVATLGDGTLVVVGSAEPLTERLFASRDNVDFLTWAAFGHIDTQLAASLADSRRAPRAHVSADAIAVEPFALPSPPTVDINDPSFVRAAGYARRHLPETVHDALIDFADAPPPAGAVLFKGLPVGELPPTPPTPTFPTNKGLDSELLLLAVGRCLGQPVGYVPEHGGDIIQNIVPVAAAAERQTSTSSKVELMFHTEAAFHPHRPRYLLLLCLRGDESAATTLASIHEVVAQLPLHTRATLFEPRYRTAVDESYLGSRPTRLGLPTPVLTGDWNRPSMTFDADLMVGIDEEAEAALRVLHDTIARHHTSVVLEAGDLLVVDNAVAVHGRTPFTPRFDGTDRWLQRAFVVTDLAASAGERHGRVITTQFMP